MEGHYKSLDAGVHWKGTSSKRVVPMIATSQWKEALISSGETASRLSSIVTPRQALTRGSLRSICRMELASILFR
jgi:hypothetical protein